MRAPIQARRPGLRALRLAIAGLGLLWLGLSLAAPALAQTAQTRRLAALAYPVDRFELEYALDHPAHPPLVELLAQEVELRISDGGLLPPHPTTQNARFALGRVPSGSRFYTAGLQHVAQELLATFQARGIDGVLVTFPEIEEGTGRDLRPEGMRTLLVRIWTGRIERVASVADGDRYGDEDIEVRTNHPSHAFVREDSPVQPGGPKGLLRVGEIEDYAFRLSRHPGRRVDALLQPGSLPGTTRVDYHVAEDRPWMVYGQITNTGTDGTTRLRERVGFSTNQLTGNDDLLRLDYVTGNFDEVQGVWGRWEAPVYRVPGMRISSTGSWSEYDASEVGFARIDAEGSQWGAGGRLIQQVFQHRELFVDLFAGARWRNVALDETTTSLGTGGVIRSDEAEEDFFLGEAGFRLRRHTEISSGALDVFADHNFSGVAGTSTQGLIELGALQPEKDFTRIQWNGALSIFLEPALRWRRYADPSTPASSTLAHELLISTQGQVSLGDRLVPQFQRIAGGMYTVRGYEQAISAGDTVYIGSAEYRLHLARLLLPDRNAPIVPVLGKVKVRPEHVYGRPDWDLILKVFVDAARVEVEDPVSTGADPLPIAGLAQALAGFEEDETLIGLGIGAELQFMKYLSVRIDLGWPQRKLEGEDVDGPEIHTGLTLRY